MQLAKRISRRVKMVKVAKYWKIRGVCTSVTREDYNFAAGGNRME